MMKDVLVIGLCAISIAGCSPHGTRGSNLAAPGGADKVSSQAAPGAVEKPSSSNEGKSNFSLSVRLPNGLRDQAFFSRNGDLYYVQEYRDYDNFAKKTYYVLKIYDVLQGTREDLRVSEEIRNSYGDPRKKLEKVTGKQGWEFNTRVNDDGIGRAKIRGVMYDFKFKFNKKKDGVDFYFEKKNDLKFSNKVDGGVALTRKIKIPSKPLETTIYYDGDDFYIITTLRTGMSEREHHLLGLTTTFRKTVDVRTMGSQDGVMQYHAQISRFTKVVTFEGASSGHKTFADGDKLYDVAYAISGAESEVTIADYSESKARWASEYNTARQAPGPNELLAFIDSHPYSPDLADARREVMTSYFKIKVVDSKETPQRQITDKSFLTSMSGACKDITKVIEIAPKSATQLPSRGLSVDVVYTLSRDYKPVHINEEGDPIAKPVTYKLDAGNGFKVRDEVKYDCVLTSGRFHSATLSFVGQMIGMDPKDTGLNTTLKSTSFSFDVTDVR